MSLITVSGSCHCGQVSFKAKIDPNSEVQVCNCSMCSMCGYQHLIVPGDHFELQSGSDILAEYQFKSGIARHFFCSNCGIKSFYVPRSNPDGYSLNVRCLDIPPDCELQISEFDGRNWSDNAGSLAHLTQTKD
ncbi:MAG TPA: GFA family protein [Xanthomonadales bacterium]|nr:GFA family protein [Xanthomonadales bacterium]